MHSLIGLKTVICESGLNTSFNVKWIRLDILTARMEYSGLLIGKMELYSVGILRILWITHDVESYGI